MKHILAVIAGILILTSGSGSVAKVAAGGQTKERTLGSDQHTQVQVAGRSLEWKNAGLRVQKGITYHLQAKGKWSVGTYCGWQGPDGEGVQWGALCWNLGGTPLADHSPAILTGRIGEKGPVFAIGDDLTFVAQENGSLYLRMNDNEKYFQDNDGAITVTISRIREEADTIQSAQRITPSATGASASNPKLRTRILKTAVVEFIERGDLGLKDAGNIIADWMTTGLNNTGVFTVYERLSLDKILKEHKLQMSGLLDTDRIATIGKIHGVEAIVTGSISKFADVYSVTAKLIDTETSQIIDVADIKARSAAAIPSEIDRLALALASE